MAEGGKSPDDDSCNKRIRRNSGPSDEENHVKQYQQLVKAVQCTDENNEQKENYTGEGPGASTSGGTIPFAAAEGKDDEDPLEKKTEKKRILKVNMEYLCKMMHDQTFVTAEMQELMSLIRKQSHEIEQLDEKIMATVEHLYLALRQRRVAVDD